MEEFRKIKDFENYEVSNFSNVRNIKTGRIIKQSVNSRGYYIIKMCNIKTAKCYTVHRLIALQFIDNPDNKICVDHIDRNKSNNNVENLRWVSLSENQMNRTISKNNKSTCTGVNLENNKWRVKITINGKQKHVGLYSNFDEAITARKEQENIHYGEFQAFQTEMDKLEYEFQQAIK